MSSDSEADFDPHCVPSPELAPGDEGYLYYGLGCKVCERLEAEEPDYEVGDEEKYLYPGELEDEQFKDRGLVLRLIRYRKSLATTGGFDATCPPTYPCLGGLIYPSEHYEDIDDDLDKSITKSVNHVISTYNATQEGEKLTLKGIVNVCTLYLGCLGLYITFECSKTCAQGSEKPSELYQAMVACGYGAEVKGVYFFRKKSTDLDLLPPNELELMSIESRKLMGSGGTVGNPREKRKFESVEEEA